MGPIIPSCFLLLFLGKFPLLAVSYVLGNQLSLMWSPTFRLCAPVLIRFLSHQGRALAHFNALPPHNTVIWTDGSVPFPFDKSGFSVLANCSLCGIETTLFLSVGSVFPMKPAPFFKLSAGLGSTNMSAFFLFFSSSLRLSLCFQHTVLLPQLLAKLAGTIFSHMFYYHSTMGPRKFISSKKRRS